MANTPRNIRLYHLDSPVSFRNSWPDWKKNPAFYVQYAHARTCGIERKAREQGVPLPDAQNLDAAALVLPWSLSRRQATGER